MTEQSLSTEQVASGAEPSVRGVALRDPHRVALDLGDRQVTFEEIDRLADRLAQRLLDELAERSEPTAEQPRVAVLAEHADALVVAVEAVRRAAMVMVPIDPTTPPARCHRLINAAGATVLLADAPIEAVPGTLMLHPLRDGTDSPDGGVARPPGRLESIMFTSGSTGRPKGVMRPPPANRTEIPILGDVGSMGPLRVGFVIRGQRRREPDVAAGRRFHRLDCRLLRGSARVPPSQSMAAGSGLEGLCVVPTVLRQIVSSYARGERIPGVRLVGTYGESITWEDVIALWAHLDESALIHQPVRPDRSRGHRDACGRAGHACRHRSIARRLPPTKAWRSF